MSDIFTPQLYAKGSSEGGSVTIHAVTPTPNSCYAAGPVKFEPAKGIGISENMGDLLLHIRHQKDGHCLPYVKPVHHHTQVLYQKGKSHLRAFAVLGGERVGSAAINLETTIDDPWNPREDETEDWQAWISPASDEASGRTRLQVEGTILLPHPNYEAQLVKAPSGGGENQRVLEVKLEEKDGPTLDVVTPRTIRYTETYDEKWKFKEVLIKHPDGSTDTVKIYAGPPPEEQEKAAVEEEGVS